jgi:hypothetical protein
LILTGETAVQAGIPYFQPPKKIKRSGLKSLFIWWLVTNSFFFVYMILTAALNTNLMAGGASEQLILTTLLCVFYIPVIAAAVLQYILLYRFWKNIQDDFASTTPGKAIGFLFIPFFNYYWYFRAFWGLAKDSNRYIARHLADKPELQVRRSKEWISLSYLIFAFGGGLIYMIVVFSVMFSSIFAMTPTTSINPTQYTTMMQPVMISAVVYSMATVIFQMVMMIDFYLTSDSILKNSDEMVQRNLKNIS